jgi:hypothetical protein
MIQFSVSIIVIVAQKDVILESSLFDGAVWKCHFTIAVLNASFPLALVEGSICPEHLAIAVSFIINIVAFVNIS